MGAANTVASIANGVLGAFTKPKDEGHIVETSVNMNSYSGEPLHAHHLSVIDDSDSDEDHTGRHSHKSTRSTRSH